MDRLGGKMWDTRDDGLQAVRDQSLDDFVSENVTIYYQSVCVKFKILACSARRSALLKMIYTRHIRLEWPKHDMASALSRYDKLCYLLYTLEIRHKQTFMNIHRSACMHEWINQNASGFNWQITTTSNVPCHTVNNKHGRVTAQQTCILLRWVRNSEIRELFR